MINLFEEVTEYNTAHISEHSAQVVLDVLNIDVYADGAALKHLLELTIRSTFNKFIYGHYHFLRISTTDDNENYMEEYLNWLSNKLGLDMVSTFGSLLSDFSFETRKFVGASFNKVITSSKNDGEKKDESKIKTDTTTYGKTISSTSTINNQMDSFNRNENAPINADEGSLTNPSGKSGSNSYSQGDGTNKDVYSGIDSFNGVDEYKANNTYTSSEDVRESNPYYYETYLNFVKRNNIYDMIINCIKHIIYEYNCVII